MPKRQLSAGSDFTPNPKRANIPPKTGKSVPNPLPSPANIRRSPRTIAGLTNNLTLPPLTPNQLALLISLCYCTGWSADRICLFMQDIEGTTLKAEEVWDFYIKWMELKGESKMNANEIGTIVSMLSEKGVRVEVAEFGRGLDKTVRPLTIPFLHSWSPKTPASSTLCPLFSIASRIASKELLKTTKLAEYGHLTPTEVPAVEQFGPHIKQLFESTLKRWVRSMRLLIKQAHDFKPLREKEHVNLVMDYIKIFQEGWEGYFGLMEDGKTSSHVARMNGGVREETAYIRSTGYGLKVLLGLLMADRLNVIEKRKKESRERVGFEKVEEKDLGEEERTCPICRDEIGSVNEGVVEGGVRLVACCWQIMGEDCLKQWLGANSVLENCPCCRHAFSRAFIDKLFGRRVAAFEDTFYDSDISSLTSTPSSSQEAANIEGNPDEIMDLRSPSPTPEAQGTSQTAYARGVNREVIDLISPSPSPPASSPRNFLRQIVHAPYQLPRHAPNIIGLSSQLVPTIEFVPLISHSQQNYGFPNQSISYPGPRDVGLNREDDFSTEG